MPYLVTTYFDPYRAGTPAKLFESEQQAEKFAEKQNMYTTVDEVEWYED